MQPNYFVRCTDIAGYMYQADLYCPRCIVDQLPTHEGGEFDGWALAPGVSMSTEDNLTEIAAAFGIDRFDEYSYDSGEFPKVVAHCDITDDDVCGACFERLGDV